MQPQETEVTVIGMGEMGSALARAFLDAGRTSTVWNRTPAKAMPLVEKGASLAGSVAAAVAASPVVVVCVSSYEATRAIVQDTAAEKLWQGKTLVQLSTGMPNDARALAAWAGKNEVQYLDGGILAWPSQIGGDATAIVMSGDERVFGAQEATLRTLGGGLKWLGADPSLASAIFASVLAYMAGHWIGFCHGAAISESEGLDVADFGALIADFAPALAGDARHMGQLISMNKFAGPESTLRTAGLDIAKLEQHAADTGLSASFPRFAAGLFSEAVRSGLGEEEHAAIIKVMRPITA